jgi:hypothetical protein
VEERVLVLPLLKPNNAKRLSSQFKTINWSRSPGRASSGMRMVSFRFLTLRGGRSTCASVPRLKTEVGSPYEGVGI